MVETARRRKMTIYTLGHASLAWDAFMEKIRKTKIQILVDIRSSPRSKTNPQFNRPELMEKLPTFGITYHHLKELGGRGRKTLRQSPNTGLLQPWRAFADHMLTEEFGRGLNQLLTLVSLGQVAIFCAEGEWQKCHRRFLADALTVRGVLVIHLGIDGTQTAHALSPGIEIKKDRITYPASGEQLNLF